MNKEIEGVFYNQPKMSAADWEGIFRLSDAISSSLWQRYISPTNRHFMLLDNSEWPSKIVKDENFLYNWSTAWNAQSPEDFQNILQGLVIPTDSEIFFFWMKELALKTTWQIFCRNWMNFLYEDEGCILIIPEQQKALVLSNGQAWFASIAKT